jgi:NAD(P)-dependent dehydrogenase (short-subunit alcohol dehydrogenase family)
MNVTRAVLPHFRQKRAGYIVFNSSYFAWTAMPAGSPYCGAKAALSAMVNCLQMEIAHLGIRCLCVEPGGFRTPVLNLAGGNVKATSTSKFEDYAGVVAAVEGIRTSLDGNQPGDPKKAVELMIDLVKGEGCAAGKTVPLRLPIGRDAREAIKTTCEEMLKTMEEWKDVIDSTDFSEH